MNTPIFSFTNQAVTVTISLLQILKIKVNTLSIANKIENHPSPYSLTSISDSLKDWHIDNLILRLTSDDYTRIHEFTLPFISIVTEKNKSQYILVDKIVENTIQFQNAERVISEDIDSFYKRWTGYALLAFPDEKSGEINFADQNKQFTLKKTAFLLLSIGLTVGIIGFLIILFQSGLGLQGVLLMILKLIGLSICSLLILNDFDNTDSIVNRVCWAGKSDCNKILTDSNAKLFGLINWSELGLVYFGGSLLFLFFSIGKLDFVIPILSFLSLSCVSFSFYSIWFQAFKAKEWCYFCLTTLVVFWLEFALLFPISSWILPADWQVYIMALISFGGMIALTFFITSFFKKVNQFNDAKLELNYIKYDSALFNQLLQSEKTYNTEGETSYFLYKTTPKFTSYTKC